MEWVEVTGKTIDAAKEAALDQLGVAEGDAELIVVSEPKSGLFGRTRGEARVRARVRPVGPRPKRQRRGPRDRTRSAGGGGRGGRSGESRGAGAGGSGGNGGSRSPGGRGGDQDGGFAVAGPERMEDGTGGSGRSGSSRRRRRRRGSGTGGGVGDGAGVPAAGAGEPGSVAAPAEARRGDEGPVGPVAKEETDMAEGMTLEEQGTVAKEFLEGLLEELGFEGSVETRIVDEETVELAANGEGLGMLVGPKGTTLAALQDVTRTVVQRRFPSRTDRILVDVAGYRERRTAALQRFTQQIAAEVVETGTERALESMSPADRKVVHDAVNTIDGVVTRSEGEDPDRYIVVAPAG